MPAIPKFDDNMLENICKIIGDTNEGLTGSEIDRMLSLAGIENVAAGTTKWRRVFYALHTRQQKDGCSNNIIAFIERVMDPIGYGRNREMFKSRRDDLNFILALRGYEIGEDGKFKKTQPVNTLSEAEQRAKSLKLNLEDRGVHKDVLEFCRAELLQDNYFHAVFEATKSVADKIRTLTELESDGSKLVDEAFSIKYPLLIINNLRDENEEMEQKGFSMLLKGMFGIFRNTTAHAPKIKWEIQEADALDLLTMASYAHRRLDDSTRTGLMPKSVSHN